MSSVTPCNTDEATTTPPTSPAPSLDDEHEKRNAYNRLAARKSRLRHQTAWQLKTLECVLANLMFLDDEVSARASGWNDLVLDDDDRMTPLKTENIQLQSEQYHLKQLLQDRQAFEDMFRSKN